MGIQRMHTRSDAAVAQNNTPARVKHRHCPKYDPFRPIGSLSRSEHTMMNIPDPVSLSEVKHHEVLSVLWWGTTREYKISLRASLFALFHVSRAIHVVSTPTNTTTPTLASPSTRSTRNSASNRPILPFFFFYVGVTLPHVLASRSLKMGTRSTWTAPCTRRDAHSPPALRSRSSSPACLAFHAASRLRSATNRPRARRRPANASPDARSRAERLQIRLHGLWPLAPGSLSRRWVTRRVGSARQAAAGDLTSSVSPSLRLSRLSLRRRATFSPPGRLLGRR